MDDEDDDWGKDAKYLKQNQTANDFNRARPQTSYNAAGIRGGISAGIGGARKMASNQ